MVAAAALPFFFVPMAVCLLMIRLGAAEFSMLRKILVPGNKQKVREKEQAARHKEHASQHRPTVASVSCNGDAESRTIEFILHNIIHKYHVVSSVHKSRNSLPTCSPPIALFFFSSPLIHLYAQPSKSNPPDAPNARKRSSILMVAATPG